ncbi:MAG: TldD/PmbA family protein [archaeon]
MENSAEKWMSVNQSRAVTGTPKIGKNSVHQIDFYPRQIAFCLKKEEEIELVADKGGLTTAPDACLIKDNILRVETRVGDLIDEQGNGVGYSCYNQDAPIRGSSAMKRKIDEITENALKTALQNYWKYHAEYTEFRNDKFKKLSKEESVDYREKEKHINVNAEEVGGILERITSRLCNMKGIRDCWAKASVQRVNRDLVSFERTAENGINKRIVSTSDVGAYFRVSVTLEDKEGREVEYSQNRAGLIPENILNKNKIFSDLSNLERKIKERVDCEVQPSGVYPVIMDGTALGVLFHEGAVAHLLSAKCIDEDYATTFEGKIGEKIMPAFLSLYNDPTKEGEWGSYNYDEEGVRSQRIPIIENGILKNYLHDRTTAGRRGIKSNGCSRASNDCRGLDYYDIDTNNYFTEPRISILEVKSSVNHKFEDLVNRMISVCRQKGLDYGLLVEGGGGEVLTGTGEFKLAPDIISRIYTNGKIVPVSSAYLLGNPYVMLNQLEMVGGKYARGFGYCGSDSGFVHTQEISPYGFLTNVEVRKLGNDSPRRLKPERKGRK